MIDSTFTQNTSVGLTVNDEPFGGAIWNSGGTLTVTGSTFFRNSAGGPYTTFGGAIGNDGTLTVANSTFFGNKATGIYGAGGGIFNGAERIGSSTGQAVVINSTFFGNFAALGGAVFEDAGFGGMPPGTVTLANTIIANSTSGGNCRLGNHGGTVVDAGHNIDDDGTCRLSGASLSGTDPVLDPAGPSDNGGPTQTIALLDGSPAIGAGDESTCAAPPVDGLDQRGFARPGAGESRCSIGAYEFSVTTTTSSTSTTEPPDVDPAVDGTYCVRESWTVTVTGSRSLRRSGVTTGTIQVAGGAFDRFYHHAPPLPARPLSGRLGFDGSDYYLGDAPALGPLAEFIPTRKFYAVVNLSFAQILVPLNFAIPCGLAQVGCLEKHDDGSNASGPSLTDLEASGTSIVDKPTSDFSLEFDISSVAQLTPGLVCGETEVCDAHCQSALSAAAENLRAAFAATSGTGKTGARLIAMARNVTRALTHAEQASPKRQLKAFRKVRSKLATLRKAAARATGKLSATTVAALEAAIDGLLAILPS